MSGVYIVLVVRPGWVIEISNPTLETLDHLCSMFVDSDDTVSKVAFIILSPSAIEASHSWLMRQFELYAIITQPIALMSVAACQASGRLCLFT